ncbi:hypothetical protein S40285_10301 [Stachybotrys chlorohalonatus IBT 40285]|uniref:Uncharacterized protein n=1 Tax=Stachybotrys chlorohalonatus (strain IBT 40285) TaxID=1283841 RepID=A0A084QPE8_STAC4|nr:hypothetical protein S40285_10301 [Stachybotrys chlorohalonata IBT 40285]
MHDDGQARWASIISKDTELMTQTHTLHPHATLSLRTPYLDIPLDPNNDHAEELDAGPAWAYIQIVDLISFPCGINQLQSVPRQAKTSWRTSTFTPYCKGLKKSLTIEGKLTPAVASFNAAFQAPDSWIGSVRALSIQRCFHHDHA